jgi:uncharacterized delta-60 repeat protein
MLFTILAITFSQTERWVYRYNGPKNGVDEACSVVFGTDGNIYSAGVSDGIWDDFIIISLTSKGQQRWVYRYNNGDDDRALSLVYGADGNIYAAGVSESRNTSKNLTEEFIVISLTSKGQERWVYRKNKGKSYSLVYGADGNIYAAGTSNDSFTIISLTSQGQERWVYCYNGECAYSLIWGTDNNIYIAGRSYSKDWNNDFTVVSLTPNGKERWVYLYNYPGDDCANSIIYGKDGNIYVSKSGKGWSYTCNNFTIISLTPDGKERWVYYDTLEDFGSLICGNDSNIYAIGTSIMSLSSNGNKRWTYKDSTSTFSFGSPRILGKYIIVDMISTGSLIWGADGNIYASGAITSGDGYESHSNFAITSLTSEGIKRWIYCYDSSAPSSWRKGSALSLVYGLDGNIYAAGTSLGYGTCNDFTIINLSPEIGK